MPDPQHTTDAFIRFMTIVTGTLPGKAPTPDPKEVRIRELEQEVHRLQSSLRQRARQRGPGSPGVHWEPGLSPLQAGSDDASSDFDDDELEKRILQNEELVQRILESAEELSEPMTAEALLAWLRDIDDSPPPD